MTHGQHAEPLSTRLQAELSLVQALVRSALSRRASARAELGPQANAVPAWHDEADGLLLELDLSNQVEAQFERRLGEVEAELEALSSRPEEPLNQLRATFRLSRRELTIWMLCAAPQLDHRYGQLYALLANDSVRTHACEELLQSVLSSGTRTHAALRASLAAGAPLRALGLLRASDERSGETARRFSVPTALVDYVLSVARRPARTKHPLCEQLHEVCPETWRPLLASFWDDTQRLRGGLHALRGRAQEALEVFARVCARAKLARVELDLRALPGDVLRERAWEALHSALLERAALAVVLLPRAAEGGPALAEGARLERTQEELRRDLVHVAALLPLCVTIEESAELRDGVRGVRTVPRLESADRRLLWTSALKKDRRMARRPLPRGLSELPLNPSAIGSIAKEFLECEPERRSDEALLARAYATLPALPLRLAMPIRSSFDWSDLILPDELRARLMELGTLFTERDRVLHDWGFAGKLPYGRAISALFTGPPGTGKTMAASIVANRLGLACYRVDLASLVSKYIGETEKNLSELFAAAERSHVVLLFDEADALFGKRTQTSSANDRYANLETSYLLQCIESYSGVVILTTNLRQNIDAAFTRRLRLVANFPFPGPDMRLRLWRSVLPADAPVSQEIDLAWLADRIELAGGPIKNAALTAACRASAADRTISMDDLLESCKQELRAAGQAVFPADFEQRSGARPS